MSQQFADPFALLTEFVERAPLAELFAQSLTQLADGLVDDDELTFVLRAANGEFGDPRVHVAHCRFRRSQSTLSHEALFEHRSLDPQSRFRENARGEIGRIVDRSARRRDDERCVELGRGVVARLIRRARSVGPASESSEHDTDDLRSVDVAVHSGTGRSNARREDVGCRARVDDDHGSTARRRDDRSGRRRFVPFPARQIDDEHRRAGAGELTPERQRVRQPPSAARHGVRRRRADDRARQRPQVVEHRRAPPTVRQPQRRERRARTDAREDVLGQSVARVETVVLRVGRRRANIDHVDDRRRFVQQVALFRLGQRGGDGRHANRVLHDEQWSSIIAAMTAQLLDEGPITGTVAVVIAHYAARPIEPLLDLVESLRATPSGHPYELRVVVNEDGEANATRPAMPPDLTVHYRENVGFNIGAWEHGWRLPPEHDAYLFLQDECVLRRGPWLQPFVAAASAPGVGLVGERASPPWDAPWDVLRARFAGHTMPGHEIDGRPVERMRCYEHFFATHGIDPGPRGDHLQSLVWFARRSVLTSIGGFPIGRNYGEAIAAEIGTSKRVQSRGLRLRQLEVEPFAVFTHPQWIERARQHGGRAR